MPKKLFFTLFLITLFNLVAANTIGAQTTSLTGVAISVSVADQNATNGQIICSDKGGYNLCKNEYDSSMFGVINDSSSLTVQTGNQTNAHFVTTTGEVSVQVTSVAGDIKSGDFITTSKTAGVGELASKTGYVIGRALEDYTSTDKAAVGTIKVAIAIHAKTESFAAGTTENLIDILRNGVSALGVGPIATLRYALAATMVITSFLLGFIHFGRIAKTGVEAIGRNPLAGARIQASVVFNIGIMIGIALVGLVTAYLILVL